MTNLSIIIPMFNEAQHIGRTLESVLRAAEAAGISCELIVADNGSVDQGPALAEQLGARVLHCPELSIGALRNRGVAASSHPWLAFIDADIEVPASWLLQWKQVRANDDADVMALECEAPPCAPWYAIAWQRRTLSGDPKPRLHSWLPTPNLCLERRWFDIIGGFSETLRSGEDKDFSMRLAQAGARLLSVPAPTVLHWGFEASWREWLGKEMWRQSSHLQLLQRKENQLRLLRFPLLCLLQCLLTLLLLLCLPFGWSTITASLLLTGLTPALLLAWRQAARQRHLQLLIALWGLHWLRLHLGGAALLLALFNQNIRRPDRG
ncbi:glycosyltransferase [Halopseudomonas xiamenensis]|uniref:glycosyltransferase n=1 Tax=Halopseudomonas xiamenensis TaxID=157792 RepID=UPI00162A41AC|nr:glycosyltransferase [Halopseudomonas xiamenensis]